MTRISHIVALACLAALASAHEVAPPNIVLPPRRVIQPPQHQGVQIEKVSVVMRVRDGVADCELSVNLYNPSGRAQEAQMLLPVPPDCSVTSVHYDALGPEPSAKILPREEAARLYREIVSRMVDPALVEFVGMNLIRSSVFPVPAGGRQTLTIGYQQLLPSDGARVDISLPRSSQLDNEIPWSIDVDLRDSVEIVDVHSPSHQIEVERHAKGHIGVSLAGAAQREPGSFLLSYLRSDGAPAASVQAFPDPSGGGWLQFLAAAPAPDVDADRLPRELTLVFDRSGSMNGEQIEQAREAARQLIAGLDADERFNLICYNHGVERFAPAPVAKTAEQERRARSWLDAINARGGTNIHDALHEALRQPAAEGYLGVVLFLTDGIATVGHTSERAIRRMAQQNNQHQRRIFTVGVGADINSHLLEKLAYESRATAAFVLPGQDIETTVATLFQRLHGPVLSDLELRVHDVGGAAAEDRVLDREPTRLRDLFAGQRVLLLGRYRGAEPLQLTLLGDDAAGERREIALRFDPGQASTVHQHVPRIWAQRRISVLVDAVRQLGADGQRIDPQDPRYRELVDEIVRLSTEHGVLSEYTAFLAEEPGGIRPPAPRPMAEAADELLREGAGQRAGQQALQQSLNAVAGRAAASSNLGNRLIDADLRLDAAKRSIQPSADRAYYRQGRQWTEGRLLRRQRNGEAISAEREIAFASDAWFALAERLQATGRHGILARGGDVLLELDGEIVLVRGPRA